MVDKVQRTGFMSEIDKFLRDYNQNRSQTPDSVTKEVEKHKKIFDKRDKIVDEGTSPIWKDF